MHVCVCVKATTEINIANLIDECLVVPRILLDSETST